MKQFTLEYWTEDGWFVGRLKEMPAVTGQGREEVGRPLRPSSATQQLDDQRVGTTHLRGGGGRHPRAWAGAHRARSLRGPRVIVTVVV